MRALRFLNVLRRAFGRLLFKHGGLGTARAAAYSSILMLFPAFIVLAALLATFQKTQSFILGIANAVGWALPPGAAGTAMQYFENPQARPIRQLVTASLIMLTAAMGVFNSWMHGFRTAYNVPNEWNWWKQQGVALLLVFLAALPMGFATFLLAFGDQIENWISFHLLLSHAYIVLLFTAGRWLLAFLTLVAVLALVYHFGLPRTQPWYKVLPGAMLAAALWFPATMAFGWYVTRFASYNVIYGPLGAAIALLVWLYLVSIVVLLGAEVNALMYPQRIRFAKASHLE